MPTPEEIKTLAELYADKECEQSSLEDKELLQLHEDKILEFYDVWGFLIESFCIVPKEVIRKEYEEAKTMHDIYTSATCINEMESRAIDHAEGRICELTTLFGKSLFNEGKE